MFLSSVLSKATCSPHSVLIAAVVSLHDQNLFEGDNFPNGKKISLNWKAVNKREKRR